MDEGFEQWWALYPKKRGKGAARKAYTRAVRGSPELPALLLADVEARMRGDHRWLKDGGRFVPDPTTYLNQERWTDELEPTRPARDDHRSRAQAERDDPDRAFLTHSHAAFAALDSRP